MTNQVHLYLFIAYAAVVDGVNIWAVVGGIVAALVVITLVTVTVMLVRRRPGSGSDGDHSDLSLNDLSADNNAMSVKTIK